jgi:hypothetical protein
MVLKNESNNRKNKHLYPNFLPDPDPALLFGESQLVDTFVVCLKRTPNQFSV